MQEDVEPVLEHSSSEDDVPAPPSKKPKHAETVQKAVLGERMNVVPPQTASHLNSCRFTSLQLRKPNRRI